MKDQKPKSKRNCFIDAYRGFTMISMILYHSCYDYFIVFGRNPGFIGSRAAYLWQQSICISFILVSGMVWPFGKKHALRRGLILILLGTAITFVTVVFMPSESIYYGILTFMGAATLITMICDKGFMILGASLDDLSSVNKPDVHTTGDSVSDTEFITAEDRKKTSGSMGKSKFPAGLVHVIICLILFALTKHLPNGYIGSRFHPLISIPKTLYRYPSLAVFGLPPADFFSADYFPIIPWIFMYILGYHLGGLLLSNESFIKLGTRKIPFLSWLGTKSLPVYIIHQPVCFGLIWLLCHK